MERLEGHMSAVDKYLAECVRIEPLAISEEFVRLPADMAYWNEQYALANQAYLEAYFARKLTWAKVWEEQKARGEKGTLADLEARVTRDPMYIDAMTREITCEAAKGRLYGVLESLRTKREMLVSLGAQMRLEQSSDLVIRDRARMDAEVARNRAERG